MAYIVFLAIFIFTPTLFFAFLNVVQRRKGEMLPSSLQAWPALPVIGGHVLLALLYTTPWDNYLVATRVWWYNPNLVLGIAIGYVPLEEYLFFIGQTALLGLALLTAARRCRPVSLPFRTHNKIRLWTAGLSLAAWLYGLLLLGMGNPSSTYLGLELAWGLIPLSLQLAFGADILWHYRRLALWTVLPGALYLSLADAFAIHSGTWTIDPQQSLGVVIGRILPLEEFIFFLLTTTLVVFGVTLMIARPSHNRARWIPNSLR